MVIVLSNKQVAKNDRALTNTEFTFCFENNIHGLYCIALRAWGYPPSAVTAFQYHPPQVHGGQL